MVKHGKRYNNILEKIDVSKLYNLENSVALAKSTASANFDETVDILDVVQIVNLILN